MQKVFIEFLLAKGYAVSDKFIFTRNLMATTNHSDNEIRLVVWVVVLAELLDILWNLQNNL